MSRNRRTYCHLHIVTMHIHVVHIVSLIYTVSTATLFVLWRVDFIQGNQFPRLTYPEGK